MDVRQRRYAAVQERLNGLIAGEMAEAVKTGDEDRAYDLVCIAATALALAIGMAKNCDPYFVEDAIMAANQDLSFEIDDTEALVWPEKFVSSEGGRS
jgi:hypothetical protein